MDKKPISKQYRKEEFPKQYIRDGRRIFVPEEDDKIKIYKGIIQTRNPSGGLTLLLENLN